MRTRVRAAFPLFILLLSLWSALPAHGDALAARQKPGAVTLRGVSQHVAAQGFQLKTRSHGTLAVLLLPATSITEKGVHGRAALHENDDVGVRGFLAGKQLRAIWVHIYPRRAKVVTYTVRGTVRSVSSSQVVLVAGGKTVDLQVTGKTAVQRAGQSVPVSQIRAGSQVRVRVQSGKVPIALSILLYVTHVAGKSVTLHGSVIGLQGSVLAVRASTSGTSSAAVHLTSATRYFQGTQTVSLRSLRVGQTITVYACCAGGPLTARSVHILLTSTPGQTVVLHGQVAAMGTGWLRLTIGHATTTVTLTSSTVYKVGQLQANRAGVLVGDVVTVRAIPGKVPSALRVRVSTRFRQPQTLTGSITRVSATSVVLSYRGASRTILLGPTTVITLNGRAARVGELRFGDQVHGNGRLLLSGGVQAVRLTVVRVPPRPVLKTVHGTIVWVSGNLLVVQGSDGIRRQVHLTAGTRLDMRGQAAPRTDLFAGESVTVRGTISGTSMMAGMVTLHLVVRHITGQIDRVGGGAVIVRSHSGVEMRVDLPSGTQITDGAQRLTPNGLQVGAQVQISGFKEQTGSVRATAVQVVHPTIAIKGVVTAAAQGQGLVIQTTSGAHYRLLFSANSQIQARRLDLRLAPADIPTGARIDVVGQVQSNGALAVQQMTVTLHSTTVRGKVQSIAAGSLSVQVGTVVQQVRLVTDVRVTQGSHTLTLHDIVQGDDISVSGYALGSNHILARRILVHRRLTGFDGVVGAVASDAFVLTAADGQHQVILSSTTVMTGVDAGSLVTGMSVHVSGYLRGDGSILATRVRATKSR